MKLPECILSDKALFHCPECNDPDFVPKLVDPNLKLIKKSKSCKDNSRPLNHSKPTVFSSSMVETPGKIFTHNKTTLIRKVNPSIHTTRKVEEFSDINTISTQFKKMKTSRSKCRESSILKRGRPSKIIKINNPMTKESKQLNKNIDAVNNVCGENAVSNPKSNDKMQQGNNLLINFEVI